MQNLYQILGVTESATDAEIKSAYKRLAKQFHPDRNPGNSEAEEQFKLINNAYQILSDTGKRAYYDLIFNYRIFEASATYTDQEARYSETYEPQEADSPEDRMRRKGPAYQDRQQAARESFIVGSVLLVVMAVVVLVYAGVTTWLEHRTKQAEMQYKSEQLSKAKRFYKASDYIGTLVELQMLVSKWPGDLEYLLFKEEVLGKLKLEASRNFEQGNYERAIRDYETLAIYEPVLNKEVKYRMALCYQGMDREQEALVLLQELLEAYPEDIGLTLDMAMFFKQAEDAAATFNYLQRARDIAISYYQKQHGDAYPLLLDPNGVADVHYYVFCEYAEWLFGAGEFQQALSSCNWARFLRPDKPDAYRLKAQCRQALGERQEACTLFAKAASLGDEYAAEQFRGQCR